MQKHCFHIFSHIPLYSDWHVWMMPIEYACACSMCFHSHTTQTTTACSQKCTPADDLKGASESTSSTVTFELTIARSQSYRLFLHLVLWLLFLLNFFWLMMVGKPSLTGLVMQSERLCSHHSYHGLH